MDAEHRHELKTNELADWLAHLPQFLKRNASTIIGVVLIIIGLVTWPMFNRMRAASEQAQAAAVSASIQSLQSDLFAVYEASEGENPDPEAQQKATDDLLLNVTALLDQADKMKDPDQAALARIKAAQALRTELHMRAGFIDAEELQTRIDQAQKAYEKAKDTATTPTLRAMAQLGLGLCAEELGQRDAAAAIYKEIIDTPEFAATIFPTQAKQRLDGLEMNLESVVFVPKPAAPAQPGPASPFNMPLLEADELPVNIPGLTPEAKTTDKPTPAEVE